MSTIDPGAVGRGALAGLLVIVPLTALRAVLDREIDDFDDSGWVPLFAHRACSAPTSWPARSPGGERPDAPLSNGLLAGVGALVLWLPLRVLIWVARSESQGLFTGSDPVFTAGQIFGSAAVRRGLRADRRDPRRARRSGHAPRLPDGAP